jgi:gliding motility-associated-like protein
MLHATHIVGGEVTYECLGDQQFRVTLTVYRDCFNGQPWFDNPVYIGIFNKEWDLVDSLKILVSPDDTIPVVLSNPCLVAPPNVCVHRTSYTGIVTLPAQPGGYSIVYQRCCRNTLIRNIIDPLDTGASFIAELSEAALLACNGSAVFNNWPPVAICAHEPIDFDHSATDPDGDSLVYRLCTPLNGASPDVPIPQPPNPGPYEEITWRDPPYDLDNVLGGQPLRIDPATGFLTGVPNTLGNFVVGICVDEYRGDTLISTTRRDFQYNVADCGQPVAAFFSPEIVCDTLGVRFVNQSFSANTYRWFFDWEGDLSQSSTQFSPFWVYPDTGRYVVALIANPGDVCSDTIFQEIHLTRGFVDAALDIAFPGCDAQGLLVSATDQSVDNQFGIVEWLWQLSGPSSAQSTVQNPQFQLLLPGNYQLRLRVRAGNGCLDSVSLNFSAPIPPVGLLPDSLAICQGDSIALFPGADPTFSYAWSPAGGLDNPAAPNPTAFPGATTVYTVRISGNGPCTAEKSIKVSVLNPGALSLSATPDTILIGASAQLEAMFPGAISYLWEPPGSLDNPAIPNPVARPEETTTYTVTATLPSGCVAQGTVTLRVLFPVCDAPFVFLPTAFSPNGDDENDVLKLEGVLVEEVYWAVYNRWGEKLFEANRLDDAWDGSFRGHPQPAETYGYILRVRCAGQPEMLLKKGNITLLR